MSGILDEVADVRTNGNGSVKSEWDDILLKRDLEQLIAEGRVGLIRDVPRVGKYLSPANPEDCEKKWFRDVESGDIYESRGGWERRGPSFKKLDLDKLYQVDPTLRPS